MTIVIGSCPLPISIPWPVSTHFGSFMREKRLERGLTLEEVGAALGTNHSTVQRYESGQRYVNYDIALKWADAVGVARTQVTSAWIAANGGVTEAGADEVRYISDPDTIEIVEFYEGMLPEDRELARTLLEKMRERARERSIGGGAKTRSVQHRKESETSEEADPE